MLSVLTEDALYDYLKNNLNKSFSPESEMPKFSGSFNPPAIALMNSLSTPQLNFSEAFMSDDYVENRRRASNGFSPEENIFTQKFKLEDDFF